VYSGLLAAYPTAPNVHYDYGAYLYASADFEKALIAFKKELALFPGDVLADIYCGLICLKIGRFTEGFTYANEAVALAPRSCVAQYELGQLLLKTGQPLLAIPHLEIAENLETDISDIEQVHYALLIAYARAGRKADAEREQAIFEKLKKSEKVENKSLSFAHPPEPSDLAGIN